MNMILQSLEGRFDRGRLEEDNGSWAKEGGSTISQNVVNREKRRGHRSDRKKRGMWAILYLMTEKQ